MFAPVAVSLNVVLLPVLVSPVKSTVCVTNEVAGLVIVRILVKPEPLLYERTRLVGPFAAPILATEKLMDTPEYLLVSTTN